VSSKQNKRRDPEKRAAKRARQREAVGRSRQDDTAQLKPSKSQMSHASSAKARRKAREGERAMRNERPDLGEATPAAEIVKRGKFWLRYLNQAEYWIPKGKPAIRIAEMDEQWRRNAAAWLLRRASIVASCYTVAELSMLHAPMLVVVAEIDGKPVEWLDPNATLAPSEGSMAADMLDRERARRAERPEEWLKATPLFRALLEGLPPAS
jgi:hypothetical protein